MVLWCDSDIFTAVRVRTTLYFILEAVVAGGASVILNAMTDTFAILSLVHEYTINNPEHYHL